MRVRVGVSGYLTRTQLDLNRGLGFNDPIFVIDPANETPIGWSMPGDPIGNATGSGNPKAPRQSGNSSGVQKSEEVIRGQTEPQPQPSHGTASSMAQPVADSAGKNPLTTDEILAEDMSGNRSHRRWSWFLGLIAVAGAAVAVSAYLQSSQIDYKERYEAQWIGSCDSTAVSAVYGTWNSPKSAYVIVAPSGLARILMRRGGSPTQKGMLRAEFDYHRPSELWPWSSSQPRHVLQEVYIFPQGTGYRNMRLPWPTKIAQDSRNGVDDDWLMRIFDGGGNNFQKDKPLRKAWAIIRSGNQVFRFDAVAGIGNKLGGQTNGEIRGHLTSGNAAAFREEFIGPRGFEVT